MDRRKAEIRSSSERLRLECEVVVDLLKKITDQDVRSVAFIESLNDKQILSDTKTFLHISRLQHSALQKVLEIGLELEVFLSSMASTESVMFQICQADQIAVKTLEYPTNDESSCSIKNEEIKAKNFDESEINKMIAPECTEINGSVHIVQNEGIKMKSSDLIDTDIKEKTYMENKKVENDTEIISVLGEFTYELQNINANIPEKISKANINENRQDDKIAESKEITVSYENSTSCIKSESSDYFNNEIDKSNQIKTLSTDSSNDEVYTSEFMELQKTSSTLQEKLKSKKLLSRRDRYLQNLPKPIIPDLSFKPSSKVIDLSDNFMSCRDSSDSSVYSRYPRVCKKKQKRELELVATKEEKIETLQVPHLKLQDSSVPYEGMFCVVSRVQSPSEIYINILDDNISIIDCLGLQIAELYDSTSSPFETKEDAKMKLGNYCVVYIEEYKVWYRAEVINWHLKGKSYLADIVTVQLVDYGHVQSISYKSLRQLIADFCHVPKYAIKCHLAALYPPTSTQNNLLEIWPVKSLQILHDIFRNVNQTAYKVTYVENVKNSWAIDLLDEKEEDYTLSVGQQLINANAAVQVISEPTEIKNKFCITQLQTAQGFHGISASMNEEQKLDRYFDNFQIKEASNLDEAMVSYKANDEANVCRFTRPDGTCFKGSKCKLEHKTLRQDGITTDKQPMFKSSFNELILPRTEEQVFLQITNVIDVNTFYACQVESMNNASYSDRLLRLLKLMNSEDTVQKYKPLKMTPTRGEIVTAKIWSGIWYRAQVQEVFNATDKNEEIIQVFIVDFGELIDVTMDNLRQIIPDFLHLPFQAMLCRLYNVSPVTCQDKIEAKEYFESNFLCQCFKAEIMYSSGSTLEVLLTKCDNEDVGQQIIEEGFGVPRTEYFFPLESEMLLVD